ncbi:MAG: hypothetical protein GX410_06475 [Elusimicrobia bacterium]|nr:hypothetical protein [Elusimicrobiota bacterium]
MRRVPGRVFKTTVPSMERGRKAEILHLLRERVKELTALHGTARLLEDSRRPVDEVLRSVLKLLPPAWQYPEITAARVRFGGIEFRTMNFAPSQWRQTAKFVTSDGKKGEIEIRYLKTMPREAEGPFLREERNLINSLAEMLCSYAEREAAHSAIVQARDQLEMRVRNRTQELERLNKALLSEVAERRAKERKIRAYQTRLRVMASQMALAEERERRDLAAELHERIGHTLALIKMGLARPALKAQDVNELRGLLEQAIGSARGLTTELGSPVLYELGFEAAVESLAEQVQEKHGIAVRVRISGRGARMDDEIKFVMFRAVRELLHNALKHARASLVEVRIRRSARQVMVSVSDNGRGFAQRGVVRGRSGGFGLFSIEERLGRFGGRMSIGARRSGAAVTLVSPVQIKAGGLLKWK